MSLQKEEKKLKKLNEVIAAVKAATGAKGVVVINRLDEGVIEHAIIDESHPDGGYMSGFPLMHNQTYILVTVDLGDNDSDGLESGIVVVDGEGVYHGSN